MGLYDLSIDFDSGTQYRLLGYDYFDGTGDFTLYTSDLDANIGYRLDDGVSAKLNKYIKQLK
ncbi:MAG TPA: hypothetical protein PKI76_06510 [Oscillospiraceae bacterium]|nr:hypothetical protein [Oscillospiraceae bacterium]HNW05019.1 hypothetical protein [Oscillospiraceae bacterium]